MFSCLWRGEKESSYARDFASNGPIGGFGGFESHMHEISLFRGNNKSDEKYRKEQPNKLGPVYANRSLRGHIFPVLATCWSSTDPGLLASVGKDGKLMLWDVGECNKLCEHRFTEDLIMSLAMSPDNNLIVCGGVGFVGRILRRGANQSTLSETDILLADHEGFIASCAFTSNTHVLTGSGDYTCKLYDVGNASASLSTFQHENEVMAVALRMQEDGSAVEFYTASGTAIALWDTRASSTQPGVRVCLDSSNSSSKAGDITSLSACRRQDHLVACGTEGGDVLVYDMRRPTTSSPTTTTSTGSIATAAAGAPCPRPRCVAACVDAQMTQVVSGVAFAHCGSLVFAGYRTWVKNYMDCVLAAFDVSAACCSDTISSSRTTPAAVNAEADGGAVSASAGDAATIAATTITGEPILAPHCVIGSNPGITSSTPFTYSYQHCPGSFVSSVQMNCDGCALATASHDGTITVFRQQR